MLRLKRRTRVEEDAKTVKKSKVMDDKSEDSSSDDDDIQIVGQQVQSGPLWHDSDDSDEESVEKVTQKIERKVGPIPRHFTKPSAADSSDSDSDDDSDIGHPRKVVEARAGLVQGSSVALPADSLRFKRLRDANADQPAKSTVTAARFHPWSPVVLVASTDRTLNLFHVDGSKNEKLASHYFDQFPLKCARFTPDGKSVVVASVRKSFRVLDLHSETVTAVHSIRGVDKPIQKFEISPDGKYIVFIGNYGVLHVIETASMEKVGTMEANGLVMSLVFASDSVLYAFSDDGRVYRFSMLTRRLEASFDDDGCVGGRGMAVSGDGQLLACGQSTGVVNVYRQVETFRRPPGISTLAPRPFLTCDNLVTACDLLRFSPAAELLLMASSHERHSVKALHLSSGRVFANFPGRADRMGKVCDMDVSPRAGFCVFGQSDGRAALFRLLHFPHF